MALYMYLTFPVSAPYKRVSPLKHSVFTAMSVGIISTHLYPFQDVVSIEDAITRLPTRNAPRVAAMIGETNKQYFVLMEQSVVGEVPSLPQALYVAFGCYYVYNLEYPPKASCIFFFFQDYLLGYPDSLKRPSSYIAVLSDIKKHLC